MTGEINKIMYVEDEPDIQQVAQIALESVGGFEVKICGSGQEALESVEDFKPDVILLDVMLPGMDGPAIFTELRKLESVKQTPIIFMTAKVQPQEVAEYKDMGAIDVIAKPFDPMTLAEQVRQIYQANSQA